MTADTAHLPPSPTPTPIQIPLTAIRNSDRVAFNRCRRSWAFKSGLRDNLVQAGTNERGALWFGTGFHFAMEDYHGYRAFSSPVAAFDAYTNAFKSSELPTDIDELVPLAHGMIPHYTDEWLPKRKQFKTVWLDGVPLVEVEFKIRIPGTQSYYTGTFDRVVEDAYGRYWVLDYKTAKKFDTMIFEIHPQISSYAWAATEIYGVDFEGVILQQHLKAVADEPRVLQNGELSTDARQKTTYKRFVKALKDRYGGIPPKYVAMTNLLAAQETADGDRYILRTMVRRNHHQRIAEAAILRAQASDMTNPDVALYPNPTRDCSWDCDFREVCIAMNDGSDYQYMLDANFRRREEDIPWRNRIKLPESATPYPPKQVVERL